MKRLSLFLTILVTILNTHLHAATFTAGQITITPGQTTQLVIGMNNSETNLSGFQFKLYLPDGFSVTTNDKGKFVYTQSSRIEDHTISIRSLDDGGYLVVAYSMDADVITGTSGELMSISVTADEAASSSDTGTLSNIRVTDVSSTTTSSANVSFAVMLNISATGISLSSTSLTLTSAGQTSTLTATVTPSNATNKNVTWTSSNTAVATVSNSGVVTAVANGTATITATTADGSNKSATCSVTVNIPIQATGISLSSTSLSLTSAGQTSTLTATVTPSNASNKSVTWTSSNTSVATVSSAGVVTAVANGTATITATTADGSNKSATCTVTVNIPIPATGISLNSTSLSLTSAGQTSTLTATVTPSNATNKNVTWTSSNTDVATVSSGGVVTAVANGTSTITATTADGSNKSASCTVTVSISPTITFADVNVKALCVANWDTNGDGELSEAEAAVVTSLSDLFMNDNNNPIAAEITSFDELQYFTGLTSLNDWVFTNRPKLTSVTLPGTITAIGNYAFQGCSNLASVNIPEGVTSIGVYAFEGCSSLTSITLPSSLISTGNDSFRNCTGLTAVHISDLDAFCRISFGFYAPLLYAHRLYLNGEEVTGEIVFPDGITSVSNAIFEGCTGITSVVIPEGVTHVGQAALRSCPNLTSVTLPSTVKTIATDAFRDNANLSSINLPEGLTSIGQNAFNGCPGLTSVAIPSSVTSIGNSAFWNCTGLTKAIYSSIEHLCSISFESGSGNPLLFAHHLYIGEQEITDLVIPSTVTSIGNSAFNGGSGITSVTLHSGVTSIGNYAFDNNWNLTTVIAYMATPPAINEQNFVNRANATLTVPYGSKAAYEAADYWKEFGTIVEMPGPPITALSGLSNAKLYTLTNATGTLMVVGNGLVCNNAILTPDHMGLVTSVSQLSSPNTDPQEGSLAALLDNDPGTYWHSNYQGGSVPAHSHYLQVELAESVNENICLQVTRRPTDSGNHITQWGVYGSNSATAADGDWEELASISMPYGSYTETLLSDPFDTKGYKYLRFYIDNTTGQSNDGQTRGFGHLSEFRLFTASDIAAYQGLSDNAYCRFALLNINNKYYLYSPAKQAFWLAQGAFCPGFGTVITISDNNASGDYRWTLTRPLNGTTESLCSSNTPYKIMPVEDFDPTEALAAFTENVDLGLTDGYYRIRSSDLYACGSVDGDGTLYGSWKKMVDPGTDQPSLWKLTKLEGGYDLQNMHTQSHFTGAYTNNRWIMSTDGDALFAFDRVAQVNGHDVFNIRLTTQDMGDFYYMHQPWGESGPLAKWCNTGTGGGTEWVLEPVNAEEATAIASIAVGNTFVAAVPCGEGTADLTFKVTNLTPWEVEVSASPEDIAGALTIPATVQNENGIEFAVKSIGDNAFKQRTGLNSVSVEEGVVSIGYWAFEECSSLTEVVLPESLTSLFGASFAFCSNLQTINIPSQLTLIDHQTFRGTTKLKSISLPEGITRIHSLAFRDSGLESITFPSTLTTVEHEAFRGCKSLASIDFNGCSAMFDYECFRDCSSLEELYVPNTVKFQNWNMFMSCTSLKTAVFEAFEEGQETWWATTLFNECSALEEVVLPSTSVVKTGFFHMCTNLKSVTYLELADNFDVVADSYHKMYHNVPVQPLFIIPKGTAETFLHAGYMKLSDLSGLPLVREEFEAEAARIAAMADELTDGDKTALSNAISNARTAVNAAEDYATIYSQIAAIKNAAKAFLATATLSDGFEVTAAYVTNPDVDRFDFGWTVAGGDWLRGRIAESKENGDVTFNNYITVWNGVALDIQGSAISQTITNLPAGNYRLEADVIATNQNDATAEVTGVNLFAGSSMTAVATENQKPQHFTVEFTQYKDGNCNIGININNTNANWVAMDNVQLYRFSGDVPGPVVEEAVAYYIQNVETGKYLNAGNSWGTHAVLSDEGLPVNITPMPDGSYTIYFLEGSKSQQLMFRASESGVFVDYNNNSNACQYWTITPATENGTFHIQSLVTDALYGQQAYPGSYLGNNPTKEAQNESGTALGVYNDVDGNILNEEGMNITWRFVQVTPDEPEPDTDISLLDNVIYIERTEGVAGSSVSLSVKMKNELSAVGCSFKLTLPKGLSLVKDTDGDVIYELSDRTKKMSVTMQDWNNGSYDFALTPSTGTATISGTDGVIITFRIKVSDGKASGADPANLSNDLIQSRVSETTQDYALPDVRTTFNVVDYILGDVNGDGNVTPADAIMILYYYFNVAQEGFKEAAADINNDGNISPADAIEALYKYFGVGNHNAVKSFINSLDPQ